MKSNPYTIKFSVEERARYDALTKKLRRKTLASLIRDALEAVEVNPNILLPFPDEKPPANYRALKKSVKVFDDLSTFLNKLETEIAELKSYHLLTAETVGVDPRKIKQVQKKDTSTEVLLNDQ